MSDLHNVINAHLCTHFMTSHNTCREDENPSIAFSITQEGAEATKVFVDGDMQQVLEHPLATLQPLEIAAEGDAASDRERVTAAKEVATAAR